MENRIKALEERVDELERKATKMVTKPTKEEIESFVKYWRADGSMPQGSWDIKVSDL